VHEKVGEGAPVGTWVLDQAGLAVQKGYQLEVYRLYKYDVTQYDPKTREGGLFVK